MGKFDLGKIVTDVFNPVKSDVFTFIVDLPHGGMNDRDAWKNRREMAKEWRDSFAEIGKKIGFKVNPLVEFMATGSHNAQLPDNCMVGGSETTLDDLISKSTVVVAMTEFSASAPLVGFTKRYHGLRVASMPGVAREMEESALSADYSEVARLSHRLLETLNGVVGGTVEFSTGHKCYFDLRYRKGEADDGKLGHDKTGFRVINFPSGETFLAPYEGERPGEPSRTSGELPAVVNGNVVVYEVKENRITGVSGDNKDLVQKQLAYFEVDGARRNIAEFGLGCNKQATARGIILEDEKCAFHWAYGRSEHIGGTFGVDKFKCPANVTHTDLIYAKGGKVTVSSITLHYGDGSSKRIWDGDWYTV